MFFILIILAVIYSLIIFKDTKGITFFSPKVTTDSEKMLKAAFEYSRNGLIRWPGSIHYLNDGNGRAELREFWIISLAIIQKFYPKREKFSEHINITLGIISQILSSIIFYFISSYFLPNYIALLLSIIYLSSAWCTEVVLYLGHIIYSQVWFLFSLALILFAYINQDIINIYYFCIFFSGFLASICFTASSASRKFPPILIASQLFLSMILYSDFKDKTMGIMFLLFGLVLLITPILLKKLMKLINNFITSKINSDNALMKEFNQYLLLNFLSPIISISLAIVIQIFIVDNFKDYLETQFIFALGMFLAFLIVLLPHPIGNIKRYITYLDIGNWASHFTAYPDQQKTFGKKIPDNFRGEGVKWLMPFFWSVMPLELSLFCLTLIAMIYCFIIGEISIILLFSIIFIGIMPTLIVELTKGLQVGKSYLSSLTGCLLTIVLGYKYLNLFLGDLTPYLITLLTIFQIYRSIKIYKNDLLPCRMGPAKLREFMLKNEFRKFYTYNTNYNTQFVESMIYGFESNFDMRFVKTIDECPKNSIFVVPPTSSKSVAMETQSEAILNGDYRKDPTLNSLLDNNLIKKYAIAKFKTLGNSNFYVNESEVTSYRYHILKQVSNHDRILSYGWVLDLELLN